MFFVETLADLEKEGKKGRVTRTSQELVVELANKTPSRGLYPNIHHHTLLIQDLLGNKIEMSRRPIIGGGKTKVSPISGETSVQFKLFPEAEALQRWQKNEFLELEQKFAKQWRQGLSNLNFDSMIAAVKNTVPQGQRLSNLQEVKDFVDQFVEKEDKEIIYLALDFLNVPDNIRPQILSRWSSDKNPLKVFAPYASYVFRVDLFFYLSLAFGQISKDRASNKIDLSYLYYLPFGMVFVSSDNLHARVAPLFMELGQEFVSGKELKSDLKKLVEYYLPHLEEIEKQGIFRYAAYPPKDPNTVVVRLWNKFLRSWREQSEEKNELPKDPELIERLNKLEKESKLSERQVTVDEADSVLFQRTVSVRKGKWRILPPEVEKEIKNSK